MKDARERGSWRGVLESTGVNLYAAVVSLVLLITTSRILGPEGRGIYATVTTFVTLFSTLGSVSLGQVLLHHGTGKNQAEWAAEGVGTLGVLLASITLLSWILVAGAYLATSGRLLQHVPPHLLAMAFLALPLMLWFDQGRYVMFALGRLKAFNISQVAGYSATAFLVILLVAVLRYGVVGAIVAWVGLYAVLAGTGATVLLHDVGRPSFSPVLARRLVSQGMRLHLTTIGTFVHLQSSVLVLNYYRSSAEVGLYQLSTQVATLGALLPLGIGAVTYGMTSRLGPDTAWPQHRRLLFLAIAASALFAIIGSVVAPAALALTVGPAFAPAVPLVRFQLLALVGMTFSIVMASQWITRGLFVQSAVLSMALAVLSLALDLTLIPVHGTMGAVASTLAVYAGGLIVNASFAFRIERAWRRSAHAS